jgi:hypothetical protein
VIEKERVAMKKRKEDFMIVNCDTLKMDDEVKAVHILYGDMFLQEIIVRKAVASPSVAGSLAKIASASSMTTALPSMAKTI